MHTHSDIDSFAVTHLVVIRLVLGTITCLETRQLLGKWPELTGADPIRPPTQLEMANPLARSYSSASTSNICTTDYLHP